MPADDYQQETVINMSTDSQWQQIPVLRDLQFVF
jgi:hypothetical protein